jgi:hypothetical protein
MKSHIKRTRLKLLMLVIPWIITAVLIFVSTWYVEFFYAYLVLYGVIFDYLHENVEKMKGNTDVEFFFFSFSIILCFFCFMFHIFLFVYIPLTLLVGLYMVFRARRRYISQPGEFFAWYCGDIFMKLYASGAKTLSIWSPRDHEKVMKAFKSYLGMDS